jgi:ABC-2 type transport system ATP-binding protein
MASLQEANMVHHIIEINNLTRSFGATKALDGLSFQVEQGQIFGLIGPDGAGKTTTLRMLCGVLRPDSGAIQVAGIDVLRQPDMARRKIGYVAQRFSLYGDLTVTENLHFFAEIYGVPTTERVPLMERLLAFSRLAPFQQRRVDALSGGMKQKLALACALIHKPAVLVLDEPTNGVDALARREFWDLLREVVITDKLSIILATPAMDEADRCHRVGFLRAGKLTALGTPRELQRSIPGMLFELRAEPIRQAEASLRAMVEIHDIQLVGDRLHLFTDPPPSVEAIQHLLTNAGIRLISLRTITPTMEDVYARMKDAP